MAKDKKIFPLGGLPQTLMSRRIWVILALKIMLVTAAFYFSFLLRFDLRLPASEISIFLELLPAVILIKLAVFWRMDLNQGWWRYVSLPDVIQIVKANFLASVSVLLYLVFVHGLQGFPRSVLLLDNVFCNLLICAVRFTTRAFRENYLQMPFASRAALPRILIVGAGSAGQMIIREIRQNISLKKEVAGFIDDDPDKQGKLLMGVRVLGTRKDIPSLCAREGVSEVIIAIPSASGKDVRAIVELCQTAEVHCKTLPGVGELINGTVSVQQIRDVDLEDLLGRQAVSLDVEAVKTCLQGKRILVTGAGGSIGSEICRQVARFGPAALLLFDSAETPLFHISNEMADRFPGVPVMAVIGDVRDQARVEGVFDELLPEVVFHAAAYKHVPMMEHNPTEAVNNNVRGTMVLADAAHRFGCRRFVMISTDKAVNPTNVMGASKRVAELYVQNLAQRSKTHFVTVRFGNVLGSAGSVIPTFREQIKAGGPVTVTHPEVTRFFMTIPEASQLVLQAGSMGKGGEIFLLDMGEPMKIVNLAEELIRLSGLRPHTDVEIVFTGLRPGEKLYEELLLDAEGVKPTTHEKIMVAAASLREWEELQRQLDKLYAAQRILDTDGVMALLKEIVPEFRPDLAGDGE